MNADVKARWVNALRSGEYQQTQGSLRRLLPDEGSPPGFCCLGVLCDLAEQEGLVTSAPINDGFVLAYGATRFKESAFLPTAVMEWAGLLDDSPATYDTTLVSLNDGGSTFEEIAQVIEEEL